MSASDPIALLERALEQTGATLSRVRSDQAGLPTPCPAFDVRTLVNHIVYDIQVFGTMLSGGDRGSPDADLIGDDWTTAYRAAEQSLLSTWRARGTEGTLKLRIGEFPATWAVGQHLSDVAVHAWDLARATGQSTDLDPEVGQAALEWARANLKPELRGQSFGPEVAVPASAPLYDRLAGFFGRDPAAAAAT